MMMVMMMMMTMMLMLMMTRIDFKLNKSEGMRIASSENFGATHPDEIVQWMCSVDNIGFLKL